MQTKIEPFNKLLTQMIHEKFGKKRVVFQKKFLQTSKTFKRQDIKNLD